MVGPLGCCHSTDSKTRRISGLCLRFDTTDLVLSPHFYLLVALHALNLWPGIIQSCIPNFDLSDESEERLEEDLSMGEAAEVPKSNWTTEDRALKQKLLRKYSKYISSLRHEFSNKKKKGKLPKEARQVLLDWWNIHYRWPYPTKADKIALAESTGLDQKQINNWFINQRKRHWKPSENMQFAVMDNLYGTSFIVKN